MRASRFAPPFTISLHLVVHSLSETCLSPQIFCRKKTTLSVGKLSGSAHLSAATSVHAIRL